MHKTIRTLATAVEKVTLDLGPIVHKFFIRKLLRIRLA